MTDEDLVYDGRARKRPPGANSTVVEVYDLLDTHPDGITLEETIEALRAGFPTDAYRSHWADLKRRRDKKKEAVRERGGSASGLPFPTPLEYGSPEFKWRAERAWIQKTFKNMVDARTARKEGDRWFKGERAPLIQIECEAGHRHMVPYDSKKGRAEDEARVQRAHIREEARAVLNDKKVPLKARKVIEQLMGIS